ncbi:MAG: UDP-N-acetylmuramoyl-L-alanyl-D-glutamate--2,6-diaminopimelate ligase [Candidatus Eisenbacteria bacterium]|uniref:UDP-N-acetylmuramoyl-L-alanyl-D-glutamate--2,6-diaminopimelate ligase n=1 Tax=Eiseniibacteriota bacterium TaxID=2212470 RepID=A0A956SDR8_UNCEI|nr:UDP-N-acetylmuramoyl-L-alanyl-D-glutamate--2,6-diaminopimelate ligase [Candidatus Eisenbacteria bacterium]MCB9464809.1 UDP-N-acetylmuramoyl-L-alanyl-D-glutamate--2,6-diaminopimelate ligase [Candidatus Eisenbacteria bacterium]
MNPRPVGVWPGDDVVVTGIHHDNRRVTAGGVFVCVRGQKVDGHDMADRAVSAGAALVVGERPTIEGVSHYLRVDDSRKALAILASTWYGHPSRDMRVVGVTGTNGKSSVTWMVQSMVASAGLDGAVLGTLGVGSPGRLRAQPFTTPEAPDFQRELAELRDLGTDVAAVEVSSHGLQQRRTYNTRFHTVVFTNLTQDHLDFHGSMDEYAGAKSLLFRREERGTDEPIATAIVNADDEHLTRILEGSTDRILSYGRAEGVDYRATEVESVPSGLALTVAHPRGTTEIRTRLLGMFQVSNLLAAFAVGRSLGLDEDVIANGLENLNGIPGRMERVERGQPFPVVVDYAHTPDALLRSVESLRPFVKGRILLVFGCGGDRDQGKRYEMGRVATFVADLIIVTDDNPRGEPPAAIRNEIHEGTRSTGASAIDQPGREAAIRFAINLAKDDDAVFLAGKGHETVQIFADRVVPFDDREVAAMMLDERGERTGEWTPPEDPR